MVGRIATRDDERLISEAGAKLLAPVLGDMWNRLPSLSKYSPAMK